MGQAGIKRYLVPPSNRTSMELKLFMITCVLRGITTSNRTSMELKLSLPSLQKMPKMLYFPYHTGRQFQRHCLVACLPTH